MKLESYNHWSQLPDSVNILFESCSYDSMFFTREWFETLCAETFEEGQTLFLLCVRDGEQVLALLPLVGDNDYKESISHRYTALYSLLIAKEKQTEIMTCLAEGLSQIPILSLALSPIAEDDKQIQQFRTILKSFGYEYHQNFFFYNWIYRTKQQSFDEYLANRPSQLRNTIKRKRRKLEKEQDYSIRMFRGNDVKQGLIDYHAIYSASWKANEQYRSLFDATAINFAKPDWSRLAVLTINGEPAAAQLWFVVQKKASIFRLAYDEKWKHYSTGSILTAYLMEYVIEKDQVEEIDFLTGNEVYKQDWMSERRQCFRMFFVKQKESDLNSKGLITRLKEAIKKLLS